MPLDPLQDLIARTALNLPEARTLALAGGGAMIAHGFVTRATHDIDLFTEVDNDEAIRVAAALRAALERCPAGVVRAGGAAGGLARGDGRSVSAVLPG